MIISRKNKVQTLIIPTIGGFSLLFLSLLISGCQESRPVLTSGTEYENVFFELDIEKGNTNYSDFESLFFTTYPHNDPTLGKVVYDRVKWKYPDILEFEKGKGLKAYIKARNDSLGYDSFRLTSKPFYNLYSKDDKILFVFKGSLPSSKGIWPAWWLNGSRESEWLYKKDSQGLTDQYVDQFSGKGEFYNTPSPVNGTDWPAAGEIDLIENINGEKLIHNTIHTCPQMCDSEWNGVPDTINCANAIPGDPNSGCSGRSYAIDSLAGTFAVLWQQETIHYFYWPVGSDVRSEGGPLNARPDYESWDSQLVNAVQLLETDEECESAVHQDWQCNNCKDADKCEFKNLKMIFNATICGVWAGNKFQLEDGLNKCESYVLDAGRSDINNRFMQIEYVAARQL